MAERKKYLDSSGEFISKNAPHSSEFVFEDEEITLDNFRKKSAEQHAASSQGKKRPLTAEERARKMILSRAREQQRYGKLSSANERYGSKSRAPEHMLYHVSRYIEDDEPAPERKSAPQKSSSHSNTRTSSQVSKKKKSKKKKQRNSLTALLLFIAAAIACCAVVYYSIMGIILAGINRVEIEQSRADLPSSEVSHIALQDSSQVKNILVLGLDDEGGNGSRSDTMMIISIDGRTNTLRMCSILRDNWVEVPDIGMRKINAAYAHGGALLAVRTVESNFRINIDGYVSIDIDSLIDVIDLIGGVDIEITEEEAKYLNIHSQSALMAYEGKQHMDGKLAVCYARIRKLDSDFGRTGRQRTLINAIMTKCRNDFSVPELMRLAGALAPYITTDMSASQLATLALNAAPTLINETQQLTIPAEGAFEYGYAGDQSVIFLDLEKNVDILHQFLYGITREEEKNADN